GSYDSPREQGLTVEQLDLADRLVGRPERNRKSDRVGIPAVFGLRHLEGAVIDDAATASDEPEMVPRGIPGWGVRGSGVRLELRALRHAEALRGPRPRIAQLRHLTRRHDVPVELHDGGRGGEVGGRAAHRLPHLAEERAPRVRAHPPGTVVA